MTRNILAATLMATAACAHSRDEPTEPPAGARPELAVTDQVLLQFAAGRAPWTFYRNSADVLSRAPGSGHAEPQLRTQYNARAATQLDASGRVRAGASFPDSAIIVKELMSGGAITSVAVMMKLRGSPQAGEGGWVWGYFDGTGGVRVSVSERGAGCVACHVSGIDYTRMNDAHP